jgi:hypothetical protein
MTPTFFEESHEFYNKIGFCEMSFKDRLKKPNSILKRIVNRIAEQFLYYPNITDIFYIRKKLLEEKNSYDALISIAAPHSIHWGVASLPRKIRKKIARTWIADCGDPFMFAENLQYTRPFYFSILENLFCSRCDKITVPTGASKYGYYKKYQKKIEVIPQGFKFDLSSIYNKVKTNEKEKIIAYAGSLNINRRNPKHLIKYLLDSDKKFKFYIFSNNLNLVNEWAKSYPNKIILSEYLPREKLLDFLKSVDFVINFQNKGQSQTPSKLIDYAIVNKPVLNFTYNKLPIKIINEFFENNYQNAIKIDNLENYKIENVSKKFLQLIE